MPGGGEWDFVGDGRGGVGVVWHDDGLRQWHVVDVGMDADELDGVAGACDDAPEEGAVARHAFVADGVFDEDDVAVVGFGVGKSEFVDEEGVAAFDGGVHGVVAHPGALDDLCRAEIECEDERDPERSEGDGKAA